MLSPPGAPSFVDRSVYDCAPRISVWSLISRDVRPTHIHLDQRGLNDVLSAVPIARYQVGEAQQPRSNGEDEGNELLLRISCPSSRHAVREPPIRYTELDALEV